VRHMGEMGIYMRKPAVALSAEASSSEGAPPLDFLAFLLIPRTACSSGAPPALVALKAVAAVAVAVALALALPVRFL